MNLWGVRLDSISVESHKRIVGSWPLAVEGFEMIFSNSRPS